MKTYFTSESVTCGHPDKVCDQIADAVLDDILANDPDAHVACEVTACTGEVHLMGEITSSYVPDYEAIARKVIAEIGYTVPVVGFDAENVRIRVSIHTQSPDIAHGVDRAAPEEAAAQASKIIRTVNFTIRTQQYDAAYAALSTLVSNYGGTVESLNLSGDQSAGSLRRANLTLRIPSEKLDAFVAGANDISGVSNYSESSDDVSDTYYDLQSRLDTQKTKMARLLQLMEKAETTSDLIELENAISDTQYMIDSYTGRLNGYDSRVNNSYVYVTIRELSNAEAVEEENTPLGQRIANAVKASLEAAGRAAQGFAVFFVAALPWLAALGVTIVIIRVIRKKTKKQRK